MDLDLDSLTEDELVFVMDKCCDNVETLQENLHRLKTSRNVTLTSNMSKVKKLEMLNEYSMLFLDMHNELEYTINLMDRIALRLGLKGEQ